MRYSDALVFLVALLVSLLGLRLSRGAGTTRGTIGALALLPVAAALALLLATSGVPWFVPATVLAVATAVLMLRA